MIFLLFPTLYHPAPWQSGLVVVPKVASKWDNFSVTLRQDGHRFPLFLSHLGKKKKIKNLMPRPGFEPTKGRLEAHRANHYTTDTYWLMMQIFNFLKKCMLHNLNRSRSQFCLILVQIFEFWGCPDLWDLLHNFLIY